MCIFSAIFRQHSACPMFVLANRDESYSRPSSPPEIVLKSPGESWVGGLDRLAGGTWLGVNENGLLVAITNRPKSQVPADVRSRGLLCRDLLEEPSVEAARAQLARQLDRYAFAGFNLLVFSRRGAFVFEGGDRPREHVLEPGVHTIANGALNDLDDPRVRRAHLAMQELLRSTDQLDEWISESSRIAGWHAEGDAAPICLHRDGSGTVSSTILAVTQDAREARYLHAGGPPCETPFHDYSPHLQSILGGRLR